MLLYKILFCLFLSLAAALLLPINRIIEVKSLLTHRDSVTLHSGVTELLYPCPNGWKVSLPVNCSTTVKIEPIHTISYKLHQYMPHRILVPLI